MRFTRQGLAAMREARWEAMGQAFRRGLRDCVTEMVGGVKRRMLAGTHCELPVAVPVHLPGTLAGGDGPESRADRRPAATAADAPRDVGVIRREAADGERFVRGENSRTASRRPRRRCSWSHRPKFSGLTAEARNSKSEIRNKSQIQKPKQRADQVPFRIWRLGFPSDFDNKGFRISPPAHGKNSCGVFAPVASS